MAYTHINLTTFRAMLAARLDDAGMVFWTSAELDVYIVEVLRTWNALTGFWRERRIITLTAGDAFYDLPSQPGTSDLLAYTVRDRDLITALQYHLCEPASPGVWTGTEMFTLSDVVTALQRRRNRFLYESGCRVTEGRLPAGGTTSAARLDLADSLLRILRAQWVSGVSGRYSNLWPSDELRAVAKDPYWSLNPGTPDHFDLLAAAPLSLQLIPPPADPGYVRHLSILSGADLDPTAGSGAGTLLGIQDDYTWAVKWGTLADLLAIKGDATDVDRARLCESRYQLGVELAQRRKIVLGVAVDGRPVLPVSLSDLDRAKPGWESSGRGNPSDVLLIGQNLIGVYPVPNARTHNLTLDLVRSAPIPATDAEYVNVGREHLTALLDYAEHIAKFKLGGAEFGATMRMLETLTDLASTYNRDLSRMPSVIALRKIVGGDVTGVARRTGAGLAGIEIPKRGSRQNQEQEQE